jgi:hypothetical protein
MGIKEFREKGYLQEVNRRFFHPLGLALGIHQEQKDKAETLEGIWDYREDLEGIYYDIANSNNERKERFQRNKEFIDNEFENRNKSRKEILGFEVEPIGSLKKEKREKIKN